MSFVSCIMSRVSFVLCVMCLTVSFVSCVVCHVPHCVMCFVCRSARRWTVTSRTPIFFVVSSCTQCLSSAAPNCFLWSSRFLCEFVSAAVASLVMGCSCNEEINVCVMFICHTGIRRSLLLSLLGALSNGNISICYIASRIPLMSSVHWQCWNLYHSG